ncbi:Zinc finger RING-type [Penicillium brevicompactum]|uniref:Zinc finger RING-type n=1 Tax=Penicillium brevicompactum TaxID=5074 RepID=UPI0025413057|nr:Zinc finger RING-type [Penicillium brevicompactum]KAJ5348937.1 Zinc finger RING-type [Penicillium brevicompactum]
MDFALRCNSLKCRAELKEKAVVTTCSHVFCHGCAEALGLSRPTTSNRRCPACQSVLLNPDDAVSTVLNPTEDYKTSVLSGLDPNTIMECAGRALGFWAYQSTQEIFYQEYRAKSLTEKYTNLNTQMDKVIHNANTEIVAMQNKISDMQSAQDDLQKKNQELNDLCREKTTKLSQMTNLYNLLKSRAMRSRMQTAASDTVSQTLTSLNAPPTSIPLATRSPRGQMSSSKFPRTPPFPVNKDGVEQLHRHQRCGTGSSKGARSRTSGEHPMAPPSTRPSWDGRNGTAKVPNPPPQHRTRLLHVSQAPTVTSEFPPGDALMERFGN